MDLDEAAKHLGAVPVVLSEIRAKLAEWHAEHPQRALLAQHAMNDVEAGLERLAALGHRFHLVEGPAEAPVEFPKMMYRDEYGVTHEMVAHSADEEKAMADDGWRNTLSPEAPKRKK